MAIEKYGQSNTQTKESEPHLGIRRHIVLFGTATTGDTYTQALGSVGMGTFQGLNEWIHTTADSVVVKPDAGAFSGYGNATTSVSSGVLTITLGTCAAASKHVLEIIGTVG